MRAIMARPLIADGAPAPIPMAQSRDITRLLVYCASVLLIVGLLALHTFQFRERNFRQDEIVTEHIGVTMSSQDIVRWIATNIHPPLWRVSGAAWVHVFGVDEGIVRLSSTLLTALALAFTFRLGSAL